MKKFLVFLLISLYVVSAIGMTVTAHYCGGQLTSLGFNQTSLEKCKCGNAKMKKNCCQTKTCSFSIKDFQDKTAEINASFTHFDCYPDIFTATNKSFTSTFAKQNFFNHHPPPFIIKSPLYLTNQVFRI